MDRAQVAHDALAAADAHLGATACQRQVVVVGDTPHDIRSGRAIGARVIAVATGKPALAALAEAKPDLLLKDLSDITPVLSLIESR